LAGPAFFSLVWNRLGSVRLAYCFFFAAFFATFFAAFFAGFFAAIVHLLD